MKNLVALSVLLLGVAALVRAQAPAATAAAPPTKVATIQVQGAILGTKEGQKAQQLLTTKFTPRKQELEKRQSDIQTLQAQMRAGSATMSAEAKDKLARDIDAKNTAMTRSTEDFNAEVQQEEGKLMNELGNKILAVIEKYASQHAIGLVIDVSNQQSPVLWADPSIDITTEIVKQYDAAYPGTGAAAPAPAAAPAAAPRAPAAPPRAPAPPPPSSKKQ